MPGAGELRNRVRFDTRGLDENDDPLGDWVDGPTVWTKVVWLKGGETATDNRLQGKKPAAFVIRRSSQTAGLTEGARAFAVSGPDVITGQVFNVTAVSPSKEPGFLDVLGTVGGAAG